MPTVRHAVRVPHPRPVVFAYFRRPAHAVALAPPGLSLVEAPEVVVASSLIVVQARRWGIARRIVTEVVELVEPERLVEEGREGPCPEWRHVRSFLALTEAETEVVETITFVPPGGMLGLTLTAARVERDLAEAFAWRDARLTDAITAWLARPPSAPPASPP